MSDRASPDLDWTCEAESEVRFSYSRPEQRWIDRTVIRAIERLSGQVELERLYRGWVESTDGSEDFYAAAVRLLRLRIDTDPAGWARVPREGPVLFVANHPFGVVDGVTIGHLAGTVRPDLRIMTHSLLCQAPEARERLFPVDFGRTPEAQRTTLATRRNSIAWLARGGAIAVFPGGSVSTALEPWRGPALEHPWHVFVGRLAAVPGVTVVPVYFHGANSRLFQLASHLHYALRIALIFRETSRLIGRTLRVSIGEPVRAADLPRGDGDRAALVRELRRRTLSLAGPGAPDPALEFRYPAHIDPD